MIHHDQVSAARRDSLAAGEIENLSQLFKAFGDPSRLRILHGLSKREMCVCDLAAILEISESAVSHQLRLLRALRLVANRREGTILYYRLADDHVTQLIEMALNHLREGRLAP
jgi:DNA-binding transcriptional ArsR family regulator